METDQRLVARREFRAAALRGHLPCLSILASLLSSRCPLVRKRVFRLALRYFWKNYPAGTVGEFSNTPLRLFSSCLTSLCHAARCLLAIRPLVDCTIPITSKLLLQHPVACASTLSPTTIVFSPAFGQAPICAWPILSLVSVLSILASRCSLVHKTHSSASATVILVRLPGQLHSGTGELVKYLFHISCYISPPGLALLHAAHL